MNQKVYEKRPIDGILLLNKPQDLTSNSALQKVKRLYCAKKAGHTGSLDPLATGMLPLCFGEATKFSQFLLDADKCYEVTGLLGIKTNTGDSTGHAIAEKTDFIVSETDLNQVLSSFHGLIEQVPPMFSALKHCGTPLYRLARAGIEIERKARAVSILGIQLLAFDGKEIRLKVTCTKGTYIRTLIEDIGDKLGVGAHVTQLHRCFTAGFEEEAMYTLETLKEKSTDELLACLLPMDRAIITLPKLVVSASETTMLRQGKVVPYAHSGLPVSTGCFRLYEEDRRFVGLGELDDDGILKVKRLIAVDPLPLS